MRSIQAFRELSGGPSRGRGQAGCTERMLARCVIMIGQQDGSNSSNIAGTIYRFPITSPKMEDVIPPGTQRSFGSSAFATTEWHRRGQAGCAKRFIIDLVVLARCVNTGSRF